MGLEGANLVRVRGLIWASLSIALVICWVSGALDRQTPVLKLRRVLLGGWVSFFLFTIWKYGFVRLDRFHLLVSLAFAPLAPLILHVVEVKPGWTRCVFHALTVACWLVPILAIETLFLPGWLASLVQPVHSVRDHAWVLIRPATYRHRLDQLLQGNRETAQLPRCRELIGTATVDVFGQDGGYAVFNELNYRPRPVFQSYFAADAHLQSLNENFYRSTSAPEFVLFGYGSLDSRFPPLPDARVLAHLLANYQLVAEEKQFLLLHKKDTANTKLFVLGEGTVRPGERIDLRRFGETNLWLQIEVRPTLSGRLRQWVYRPAQLRLAAWDNISGKLLVRNRSPAPLLGAGFLASPLLLKTTEVRRLYQGQPILHPGAYSVEISPNERSLWQDQIVWRLYRVDNQLEHHADSAESDSFEGRIIRMRARANAARPAETRNATPSGICRSRIAPMAMVTPAPVPMLAMFIKP
jgi:hypothetical protein